MFHHMIAFVCSHAFSLVSVRVLKTRNTTQPCEAEYGAISTLSASAGAKILDNAFAVVSTSPHWPLRSDKVGSTQRANRKNVQIM